MFSGKKDSPAVVFIIVVAVFMLMTVVALWAPEQTTAGKATATPFEDLQVNTMESQALEGYLNSYGLDLDNYLAGGSIKLRNLYTDLNRAGGDTVILDFLINNAQITPDIKTVPQTKTIVIERATPTVETPTEPPVQTTTPSKTTTEKYRVDSTTSADTLPSTKTRYRV